MVKAKARATEPVLGPPDGGADAGQAAPATPFDVTRLLVLTDEDLRILAAWGAVARGMDEVWEVARMVDRPTADVARRVAALRALGAITAAGPLPEAVRAVLAARAKALLEGLRSVAKKQG